MEESLPPGPVNKAVPVRDADRGLVGVPRWHFWCKVIGLLKAAGDDPTVLSCVCGCTKHVRRLTLTDTSQQRRRSVVILWATTKQHLFTDCKQCAAFSRHVSLRALCTQVTWDPLHLTALFPPLRDCCTFASARGFTGRRQRGRAGRGRLIPGTKQAGCW